MHILSMKINYAECLAFGFSFADFLQNFPFSIVIFFKLLYHKCKEKTHKNNKNVWQLCQVFRIPEMYYHQKRQQSYIYFSDLQLH